MKHKFTIVYETDGLPICPGSVPLRFELQDFAKDSPIGKATRRGPEAASSKLQAPGATKKTQS